MLRSQLRRQMVYGMHDISQEYTVDGIYAWTLVTTMYPSAAWNLFGTYWALFGIQLNTRNMLRSHLAGYSSRMIQWEPSVFYVVQVSRKVRRIFVVECKKQTPEKSRIFQILENSGATTKNDYKKMNSRIFQILENSGKFWSFLALFKPVEGQNFPSNYWRIKRHESLMAHTGPLLHCSLLH